MAAVLSTARDVTIAADAADGIVAASLTGKDGVYVSLALGNAAQAGINSNASGDILTGIENLIGSDHDDVLVGDLNNNELNGGIGDDTLIGGLGDDTLLGGAGADTLNGGAGTDTLTGGAGNDIFVVQTAAASIAAADVITDFASGDMLDITTASTGQVWWNNNADSGSSDSTNDTNVNDLILYGDAAKTQVLAVILDYTTDPVAGIFEDTITVNPEI